MFRSYWFAAIAVGLAAAFPSTAQVINDPVIDAKRPTIVNEPDNSKSGDDGQQSGDSKTGNFCGPSYTLSCGPRYQTPTEESDPIKEAREKEDLIAQQSMASSTQEMAGWTVVMAVASVLATIFAGVAAILARNAVLETRRIGEAQVRAYINVENTKYLVKDEIPAFRISVRNSGQSPAKSVRFIYHWSPDAPGDDPIAFVDGEDHSILVVPSGGTFKMNVSIDGLTGNNRINFNNGHFPMWVYGRISYCDVFDRVHNTMFRYKLVAKPGEVGASSVEISTQIEDKGNDCD